MEILWGFSWTFQKAISARRCIDPFSALLNKLFKFYFAHQILLALVERRLSYDFETFSVSTITKCLLLSRKELAVKFALSTVWIGDEMTKLGLSTQVQTNSTCLLLQHVFYLAGKSRNNH